MTSPELQVENFQGKTPNSLVTSTLEIPEREDRIINIVKGQEAFKNKSQAVTFIIQEYERMLGEQEQ